MKTHDLAKNLEQIASILKLLPNNDISKTLNKIQKLVEFDITKTSKDTPGRLNYTNLPDGIIDKIKSMPPIEVGEYLESDSNFVSTASVLKLSSSLGIETSKRQNRSALINSIVRHLESGKMNSIIRNSNDTETKSTPEKE